MFALKAAFILSASTAVFAHPLIRARTEGGSKCSSGSMQCCDSIAPAGSTGDSSLGGLIPVNLQGLNVPIGVNCNPVNVPGLGTSGTCSTQTACCDNNNSSGLIPLGINCSPINAGL
ncbi:fungal hydrophobin [Fomitiporia mediterranea MF3/22]|uniref:fungal hydrophobin n=1 Tax=Fomitiporia mediterranea (strain MF3/22) TaxID=694068 RepID=UPI0004407F8E|nr:fungal hydrophobin [Fomitiporia mediterranea MF3/22]EJD00329.1 fungal hydrophobin [Fomitiporia mediterranea MF3/22]